MSSILDALKKLEEEKDEKEQDIMWPQPVNTRLTLSAQLKKSYVNKLAIGIGGFLFVLISVVYLLSGPSKKDSDTNAITNRADQNVMTAEEAALKNETMEDAKAFDETLERPPSLPKSADDAEELPADVAAVDNESKESIDALTALVSKKKSSLLESDPSESKPKGTDLKNPRTADFQKQAAELVKKLPNTLVPPEKTADGNWLKLHAISWSSNPLNRIAVINSQIVKEGRRVEGGLVKRIDKDYVVIEKDGEELMLPFNNN